MSYRVHILQQAALDFEEIIAWLAGRSPQGAARLMASFDDAVERLGRNPYASPVAAESEDLGIEVRHILFRTRAGRTYRAVFLIEGDEVRILRVRAPGHRPLRRGDLEMG